MTIKNPKVDTKYRLNDGVHVTFQWNERMGLTVGATPTVVDLSDEPWPLMDYKIGVAAKMDGTTTYFKLDNSGGTIPSEGLLIDSIVGTVKSVKLQTHESHVVMIWDETDTEAPYTEIFADENQSTDWLMSHPMNSWPDFIAPVRNNGVLRRTLEYFTENQK